MSDPQDDPITPAGSGDQGGVASDPAGASQEQPEPYLFDYADREAAEKGFREKDAMITRTTQENARLKDELLTKLAETATANTNQKDTSKRDQEIAETREQWKKRIDEGSAEDILEFISQVATETDESVNSRVEEAIKSLKAERDAEISAIKKQMRLYDPNWQKHSQQVEALREEYPGVPEDMLLKFAQRLNPSVSQPATPAAPANSGDTHSAPDTGTAFTLDPAVVANLKTMNPGLSDEKIQKLGERMQAKRKG